METMIWTNARRKKNVKLNDIRHVLSTEIWTNIKLNDIRHVLSTEIIDNPLKFGCGIWVQRGWQQNTNNNVSITIMWFILQQV